MNNTVPLKLYKYKSLSGDSFEHTMDILMNNRVYMSEINELNDPFEGINNFGFKLQLPNSNRYYPIEIADTFSKSCGVCSLSEKPDIPQMWVHYADNFRGICIEFPTHNKLSTVKKVNYDNNIISNIDTDNVGNDNCEFLEKHYMSALLQKSENWGYEKEWRLISFDCLKDRYVQLEEAEITTVYLGSNISPCIKKLLWLWSEKRENTIIKECFFKENSYKMEFL